MKEFTEQQVDDIIKLKFGELAESLQRKSYVSDRLLGKPYKVSASKIRQLYMARFTAIKAKQMPLPERLRQFQKEPPRERYGLRFLKPHQIKWLTSSSTLRKQTAMSLKDRCLQFLREFPAAKMNATLLR